MLSSYLFFCRPLLHTPFTVPCRTVFAMPDDLEIWPYNMSFRFFTMIRRSSCTPVAFWILLRTSSFITSEQKCLLATRQNDNHSPGPNPGRLDPSSHQRSELSNTILGTFSRGDKRVWKCIPILSGLGENVHL